MLRAVILVGLGGGIGSILRYLTGVLVNKHIELSFPLATFIVNVLGCLVIGILVGLFERFGTINADLHHLFVIGFCGGFTTFSTFALENFNLFQSGSVIMSIIYIIASILICILSVWLGIAIAR